MKRRPLLLDLFCGAGGCAMGYHRAGFDVIGVDIKPQPRYPFAFVQGDALAPPFDLRRFDAIHASPPCQAYTLMRFMGKRARKNVAPDLVAPTRNLIKRSGLPYVIENVVGSPLGRSLLLCGSMFDLGVRRHRLFESNILLLGPECRHSASPAVPVYGHSGTCPRGPVPVWGDGRPSRQEARKPGDNTYRCNRASTLKIGSDAMGIDWMTWKELTQAIPPAYTEHIGRQLLNVIGESQ